MNHRRFLHAGLVFVAFGLALPGALAAPTALPSSENDQGQVKVTVTPTLSDSESWQFAVQFNTHVAPLSQDIAAISVLTDDKGNEEKPLAWQGDPPGGHHRQGVLLFKPFNPRPDAVTLKIREVGSVPERAFTWKLTGQ